MSSPLLTDSLTLLDSIIDTGQALLGSLGVEFDEAKGLYYYDTILVKRSIEGASASGPCELCEENEGMGWIDSEDVYPSGHDGPPFHPNCFLGGTLVAVAGSISAQTKRWHEGEIITLRIAGVDDLSCTPNHPILTRRGWIPARMLTLSDELLQCISPLRALSFYDPHNNHIESRIEDVSDSLLMAGGMASRSVPIPAEAFHGDVQAQGKVDIVRAARAFPSNVRALRKLLEDQGLGLRRSGLTPFANNRTETQFLNTSRHSSHGSMSGGAVRLSLLSGQPLVSNQLSITATALLESEHLPVSDNHWARNADPFSQIKHAMAGQVRVVKLSEINSCDFAGHVFNLETRDGWYSANTIISHNCVCSEEYKERRVRIYF